MKKRGDRFKRVKVTKGFVVMTCVPAKDPQTKRFARVSRVFHAISAAEAFKELASSQYPDAYVTDAQGLDDLPAVIT